MMDESKKLEVVKRRIAALRAKAVNVASSEAEMTSCAELAQKLMIEHGVTEQDLKEAKPGDLSVASFSVMPRSRSGMVAMKTAVAVSRFTETIGWYEDVNGGIYREFKFAGFPSDVALAEWLLGVITQTADYETDWFKARHRVGVKQANDFLYAFCGRICTRLEQMRKTRHQEAASTGTSLVVVKKNTVESNFREKFGWLPGVKHGGARKFSSATAYNEGRAAGDRANLNMAVGGRGERGRLT